MVLACAAGASHAVVSDADVREILRDRIEVSKRGIGIVVGIVDEQGARVVAYGHARRGSDELVDGNSVFEIGSITKVFTALLLADMVVKREVQLHDPIAKYVPASVKSPRAKDITLLHLARHTAGLPSFPDNLKRVDPGHPFDGYTNEALFAFLDGYKTRLAVGTHHSYSNYGAALLGEVLARRAQRDFETAMRERILAPVGMTRTGFALTPELRAAHALGHSTRGRPLRLGGPRGMLGSGALRSTVNDLLVFVQANLGLRETSLSTAMRATHRTDADRQMPDLPMGLGWFHMDIGETRMVWHSGGTSGFRSFVGLDPARRRGVVVLSNSDNDVANIGIHLLEDSVPLHRPSPPREFTAIVVDATLLDEYVGTYKRTRDQSEFIAFTREGNQLMARNRRETTRVFAESPTTFFTEDMEDWGTFTRDAAGRVDGMTWYRENWQQHLMRVK
jgi:D-alanyl-D-alanine-carboxypeptidase/D-alanyl-D-alanine-endopeptidase